MHKSLEEVNAKAYEYQLAVANTIKTICGPLRNLGISNFCHERMFHDGSYMSFFSESNYAKIHFSSVENLGPIFTEQCNKVIKGTTRYFFVPNDIKLYDEK